MPTMRLDLLQQKQKKSAALDPSELIHLTASRLDLVKVIALHNPKSLYHLSQIVGKNQANILRDARMLANLGIIKLIEVKTSKRISLRPRVVCEAIEIRIFPKKLIENFND